MKRITSFGLALALGAASAAVASAAAGTPLQGSVASAGPDPKVASGTVTGPLQVTPADQEGLLEAMPSVDAVMKDYSDVFAGTEWDAANGRLVVLLASSAGDARLTSARAELADVKAKAAVEVQVVPRSRAELVAAAEKLMRIQARFLSDADAALYAAPQPRSGTLRVGVTARSVAAWEAITSKLNLGVPIDLVEESTDQAVVPESRNNDVARVPAVDGDLPTSAAWLDALVGLTTQEATAIVRGAGGTERVVVAREGAALSDDDITGRVTLIVSESGVVLEARDG